MFKKTRKMYVNAGSLHTAITVLEALNLKVGKIKKQNSTRIIVEYKGSNKDVSNVVDRLEKYSVNAFV